MIHTVIIAEPPTLASEFHELRTALQDFGRAEIECSGAVDLLNGVAAHFGWVNKQDFFALRACSRAYFKTFALVANQPHKRAFLRAQPKRLQARIRERKGVPTCPG